jgi:hypothetical protein
LPGRELYRLVLPQVGLGILVCHPAISGSIMRSGKKYTVGHMGNLYERTYLPIMFTGDLIYVYVLGNPIIVVNSAQVAEELFEKRSKNYSSR